MYATSPPLEAGILYQQKENWFYFTFGDDTTSSAKLNFDKVGSTPGLYSAIDPVSKHKIMICDDRDRSDCAFGYILESWLNLSHPLKVSPVAKIYSHGNGKTRIFQPVTLNNRGHLSNDVKDYICFVYWLIKQELVPGHNMCYYFPKCLVNKYVFEFGWEL